MFNLFNLFGVLWDCYNGEQLNSSISYYQGAQMYHSCSFILYYFTWGGSGGGVVKQRCMQSLFFKGGIAFKKVIFSNLLSYSPIDVQKNSLFHICQGFYYAFKTVCFFQILYLVFWPLALSKFLCVCLNVCFVMTFAFFYFYFFIFSE